VIIQKIEMTLLLFLTIFYAILEFVFTAIPFAFFVAVTCNEKSTVSIR
jgi:hypothetical protein